MARLLIAAIVLGLGLVGQASAESPVMAYGPDYAMTFFGNRAPFQVYPWGVIVDGDATLTGQLTAPGLAVSADTGNRPVCINPSGRLVIGGCTATGPAPAPGPGPSSGLPWADVRAFGASPSASASTNRAAMQAAHDSLPSKGGVLFIPAGVYPIDGAMTISKSITVRGDGSMGDGLCCGHVSDTGSGSTLWLTSMSSNGLYVNALGGVTIRDLSIAHDRLDDPTAGASIYITGPSNNDYLVVENVGIFNAFYAIYIDRAQECMIRNVRIMNTRRDGIVLMNRGNSDQGTCDLLSIGVNASANNGIHDYTPAPGSAAILTGAGGMTLTGSHIEGVYDYGIRVATESLNTNTGNVTIAASYIEGFKKTALYLDGGGPWTFGSVVFVGNVVNTNEASVTGVTIEGSFADVVIGSNKFYFYGAPGSKGVYIAGPSPNIAISGNAFAGMTSGVQVDGPGTDITVGANSFYQVESPLVGGASGVTWSLAAPATFATLPANGKAGSVLACTDCRAEAPCAPGGGGALAKRFGDRWTCN